MNGKEAIIKMLEGHKITHKSWPKGDYAHYCTKRNMLVGENGDSEMESEELEIDLKEEGYSLFLPKPKKKYWMWVDTKRGSVLQHVRDDNGFTVTGVKGDMKNYIKIPSTEVEL